jgi:hypothetical protein
MQIYQYKILLILLQILPMRVQVMINVVYVRSETEEIVYIVMFLVCFSFVILMSVIIRETKTPVSRISMSYRS